MQHVGEGWLVFIVKGDLQWIDEDDLGIEQSETDVGLKRETTIVRLATSRWMV